ncbi:MAG: aminodeoxychorismate synthase component I [Candidatus Omnitrophota bacterium]
MFVEKLNISASPAAAFSGIKDLPYAMLLESQKFSRTMGRFSFLFAYPEVVFMNNRNKITILRNAKKEFFFGDPFMVIRELLKEFKNKREHAYLPFSGMAVGYFGYELRHFIEKVPAAKADIFTIPDCVLGFYNQAVIYDHLKKKVYYAACAPDKKPSLKHAVLKQISRQENFRQINGRDYCLHLHSNFTKTKYIAAVNSVKRYIKNGDIYQANLAQRFTGKCRLHPYILYERLRKINPVCYGAYLNFGDFTIVSASPEKFLTLKGRHVSTRPMKGTRPRGDTAHEDRKLKNELIKSAKDKAELVMIVDLERNDLGRVCAYRSIEVKRLRILESYATVFQTTSVIDGRLIKGKDALDLLRACFPGGSITGAPKIRAMEIISEIEQLKRSVYTGAIGYIGFSGDMDLSIAIRTLVWKNNNVCFHVGGGIVADSTGEQEYQETLHKAKALLCAISAPEPRMIQIEGIS